MGAQASNVVEGDRRVMASNVELSEVSSSHLSEAVPYAVVAPPGSRESAPLTLCVVLMGGGGSRQSLVDLKPLLDSWWSEGVLAPMVFVTPSAGMSYYVEDPAAGIRWESFIFEELIPHLRANCNVGKDRRATAMVGISMGGYGALKIAFAHPGEFATDAAICPMLEPGFCDTQVGSRNRLHHPAGGPERLIGPGRDPELFAANNPANRARANASRIRESGLPIFLEAGDSDFVNAHDGAEFLHRVLWDLDISHEYRLARGGDHGGDTFRPRMRAAFAWLSAELTGTAAEPSAEERALHAMRAQLQPLRDQAARLDPTAHRRFGILPQIS
jgi:S-formylglutathione hydrolase